MIYYNPGKWSISFAFSLTGSVFPKSFLLAAPTSIICMIMHQVFKDEMFVNKVGAGDVGTSVLQGFTFILGFLVVFRSQQAYSRWWEGGTLLQQIRGEWFNAYSSLLSFCNSAPEKAEDVEKFQHTLVRLVSLLYSAALRKVSTVEDKSFELIELDGLNPESLAFMQEAHDPAEIVLQWIQRLIVDAAAKGTINIAPPILSRVYNQLGNGIVGLNNAQKITDFPIPFPLAQMITIMLLSHLFIAAIMCATSVEAMHWAGILCFLITMSYWSINFIAVELEMPFGDDSNDLPIFDMQKDLNRSLTALLHPQALAPPSFDYAQKLHKRLRMRVHQMDTDLRKQVTCDPEEMQHKLEELDAMGVDLDDLEANSSLQEAANGCGEDTRNAYEKLLTVQTEALGASSRSDPGPFTSTEAPRSGGAVLSTSMASHEPSRELQRPAAENLRQLSAAESTSASGAQSRSGGATSAPEAAAILSQDGRNGPHVSNGIAASRVRQESVDL